MALRMSKAGVIGTSVGIFGWLIALFVVCALSGSWALWWRFGPAALCISAAVAGAVLATVELLIRHYGYTPKLQLWLWAEILLFMGLLLLMINHWLLPQIRADPDLFATMKALGAVTTTGDGFAMLCLLGSTILWLVVLVQMSKDERS